jgi:hypothetical protein
MAKLTVTLDTEDQSVSVDVDGQAVANINEISVSNWGTTDDPRFSFYVQTYERVGGVHRMTRLMAKDSPEATAAAKEGVALAAASLPGMVAAPGRTKAQGQIPEWFRSTRR